MLFTDPIFICAFLPAVCIAFYVAAKRGRFGAVLVMVLASALFYAPWGAAQLLLLATSMLFNFCVGSILGRGLIADHSHRARLYGVGQVVNICVLIWFKYQIVQAILHPSDNAADAFVMAAIPAGISFYTFHQAAFLADCYNGERATTLLTKSASSPKTFAKSFLEYVAFVAFFPQLVIGPITYFHEYYRQRISPKFGQLKTIDLNVGMALFCMGLFKKLVIADNLAPIVESTFNMTQTGQDMSQSAAWVGVLSYYLQLYFDFSGYSDMALGVARLFGIRYPINFFSPFKAVGIIDFYKRWHMTLTRVIARFVYTPLSLAGTRQAFHRRLPKWGRRALSSWLPLLINFEIIALWHGARPTFVLFGVIHGAWYVAESELRQTAFFKQLRARTPEGVRTFVGRAIFVVPMMLTFALFRSETVEGWTRLVAAMFSFGGDFGALPGTAASITILGGLLLVYFFPNSAQLLRAYRPGLWTYESARTDVSGAWVRWRPSILWGAYVGSLLIVGLYFAGRQSPFLYQGF